MHLKEPWSTKATCDLDCGFSKVGTRLWPVWTNIWWWWWFGGSGVESGFLDGLPLAPFKSSPVFLMLYLFGRESWVWWITASDSAPCVFIWEFLRYGMCVWMQGRWCSEVVVVTSHKSEVGHNFDFKSSKLPARRLRATWRAFESLPWLHTHHRFSTGNLYFSDKFIESRQFNSKITWL